MRDLSREALEYAGMGYPIFPIHSPSPTGCDCGRECASPAKHPRTRNGFKDATTDLAQIGQWWSQWAAANIGLATGKEAGVVVIDIDVRHNGLDSWTALVQEHGDVPEGPVAQTGSGGYHFFFAYPEGKGGVPSRNGAIAEGIDQKADGGYVVLPPSVHVTGAPYLWCEDRAPWQIGLPALPLWLYALLVRRASGGDKGSVRYDERLPAGRRRDGLLSLAGTLRNKGASRAVILAALLEMNSEQCDPPLDLTEVSALAADVARRYEPQVEVPVIVPKRDGPRPVSEIVPYRMSELQNRETEATRVIVPGLLPEGLSMLVGPIKFGKSYWALDVAIAVAEGGIAFGELPVDDGDVLYLALEDTPESLKERMQGMMLAGETWPERLEVVDMSHRLPKADAGGVEFLTVWLGQHPEARLVIVDVFQRFRSKGKGGKGNAYAEDYDELEPLQVLAGTHRVCILLLHHFNKSIQQEDWVDRISGTSGMGGSCDTVLGLSGSRDGGEVREAVLKIVSRKLKAHDDYAMQGREGHWYITGDAAKVAVRRERKDLVDLLKKIGHPASPEEVAAATGSTRPAAYRRLYRAALDGDIRSHGGKLFSAELITLEGRGGEVSYLSSSVIGGKTVDTSDRYDRYDRYDSYDTFLTVSKTDTKSGSTDADASEFRATLSEAAIKPVDTFQNPKVSTEQKSVNGGGFEGTNMRSTKSESAEGSQQLHGAVDAVVLADPAGPEELLDVRVGDAPGAEVRPSGQGAVEGHRQGYRPEGACMKCHEVNWLPKAAGGWVCGTCRPWITEVVPPGTP